jgi:hypothetical protein
MPTDSDNRLEEGMRPTDNATPAQPDDDEDYALDDGVPSRAERDLRTGGNRIGDNTAVGLEAAPPPPPIFPGDDEEFNRAGSQSELTAPKQSIEELVASGRNSKTPIPMLDHQPKTPIPRLDGPQQARATTKPPMSTAPTSLPPPKQLDSAPSGPTPACPQCESPMAWVEEHLRFYCKQCRMYF